MTNLLIHDEVTGDIWQLHA